MKDNNRVSKKKILFVLASLRMGGAERVVVRILNSIDREKFQPTLAVIHKEGELLNKVKDDVQIYTLSGKRALLSVFSLKKTIKIIEPDIIFSTAGYVNLATFFASAFQRKRNKLVFRHTWSPTVFLNKKNIMRGYFYKLLYSIVYNKADCIISQSKQMTNELNQCFNIPLDLISTILNPVAHYDNKPNDFKKYYLVAMGRIEKQKGFDVLVRAIKRVKKKCPEVSLEIFGKGSEEEELKELVQDNDLDNTIVLKGFVNHSEKYISKAHLFILSSRHEGLSNAMLEALACGVPVISTMCAGGSKEIIKDGKNGFLCNVDDDKDLANKILNGMEHGFERGLIKEETQEGFGIPSIISKYEALFLK
jgi:glycosyltransferase involved in cell wall biosynthesis